MHWCKGNIVIFFKNIKIYFSSFVLAADSLYKISCCYRVRKASYMHRQRCIKEQWFTTVNKIFLLETRIMFFSFLFHEDNKHLINCKSSKKCELF